VFFFKNQRSDDALAGLFIHAGDELWLWRFDRGGGHSVTHGAKPCGLACGVDWQCSCWLLRSGHWPCDLAKVMSKHGPLTEEQMAGLVREGHERFLYLAAAIATKKKREAKHGLKQARLALDALDEALRRMK
jgi:hypothetical protein